MAGADSLQRGLDCLERRQWSDADRHLTEAQAASALPPSVIVQLAAARLLLGRQEDGEETWLRAHESFVGIGDPRGAARCAFWLGLQLMLRGEMARGGGWFGRAHEVLASHEECAEHGLVMLPEGLMAMGAGQADAAEMVFARARDLGRRFDDSDVVAMADLGSGQALLQQGQTADGLAVLDRLMAGVEAATLSPVLTGMVYCAVIENCQRVFDVARAREWTTALSRWLGSQPDVVAFRGHCLVYRAEVVQRHGDWGAAVDESRRALAQLSTPPGHPATGLALYRLGELHRVRGELDEADASYLEANRWGHSPQPGLALLRLDQGHVAGASATIRQVLTEVSEPGPRAAILAAAVRILLADEDLDGARQASEELTQLATHIGAPFVRAHADHWHGCLSIAEGQPEAAVGALRSCLQVWLDLQAPHEEALTRVALGVAYRSLGDHDSARLELDTAHTVLVGLGAAPDLARLDANTTKPALGQPELSLRELQVLRLVATGATNRAIAESLFISVRTVDRHVSNLYTKLGVSTRTAATAWAYERELI